MKTNGEMKHGGQLKPEYRQTWADYFVKYVLNPNGRIAVVLTNLTDHQEFFQLWIEGRALRYSSPGHAIITMVL